MDSRAREGTSVACTPAARTGLRILCLVGALLGAGGGTAGPVAAAVVPKGFVDELVVNGLSQPVGMAWLPDGRLLVIEQRTARVRLVANGALLPAPIFTVPGVNGDGNERGLLGIAVDPGFPQRPYVYLYYSGTVDSVPRNHLVRYALTGDTADGTSTNLGVDAESLFTIFNDAPDNANNHNGGTVRFGPPPRNLLYVSLGEDANACTAQDPGDLRGVLLRLDVSTLPDGPGGPADKTTLVPPDNPFAADPNPNAGLTAAFGLRNPFRFHVDPPSERVFIADVGLRLWEEVDLLEPDALGQNFGWPFREGPGATGAFCSGISGAGPFSEPIAFYDRQSLNSASVISAGLYRPVNYPFDRSFPPEYDGDYFFAEYYNGFLRRIEENQDGTWSAVAPVGGQPNETDWATGLSTTADFGVGPDGALYYVSQFGGGGSIRRIGFAAGTILAAGDAAAAPGATGVAIDVTTSAGIEIGTTDLRLRFDPTILQAATVASDVLEGFLPNIDNVSGTITAASASAAGQTLAAGEVLFTVTFDVLAGAPSGCTPLIIEDADGEPPDDLGGPVPPIPPSTIVYGAAAGAVCVHVCGNGVVEAPETCDDGNIAGGDCCSANCQVDADGTACEDGLFCTAADTCQEGACQAGPARDCSAVANTCNDALCDEATDQCLAQPRADGAGCEDGLVCTVGDTCNAGVCQPGAPADCTASGDQCNTGVCDETAGGCVSQPIEDGTPCDDGSTCTGADACLNGACRGIGPSGAECQALGDVDCDGRGATPIDAQVILCLEVGRCVDADVPAPCSDPALRTERSDWNLDGVVDPIDAATSLGIFVGNLRPADTPLGVCCVEGTVLAATLAGVATRPLTLQGTGTASDRSKLRLPRRLHRLRVDRGAAAPGAEVQVAVRAHRAMDLASTSIALRFDPTVLQAERVVSPALSRFTHHADNTAGLLRVASATADSDHVEAGAALFTATFRVQPDARRRSRIRITAARGSVPGHAEPGSAFRAMPQPVRLIGNAARFNVRR